MNSETKQILNELERVDGLLDDAIRQHDFYNSGWIEECTREIERVIAPFKKIPKKPSVFENMPLFPPESTELVKLENEYRAKKKTLTILIGVVVASALLFFITRAYLLNAICSAGIIGLIIYYFVFLKSKTNYFAENNRFDEQIKASNESMARFKSAMTRYAEEKKVSVEGVHVFVGKYDLAYQEYVAVLESFAKKKEEALKRFISNMEQAKQVEFLPGDYYPLIKPVIVLLKSGRADTYKEALNMAIAEQKEQEAEAARRAEEEKRTRLLEEQALAEQRRLQEAERHNREMEQQQQMQAKMLLDEQRKSEREAKRATANAQRDEWSEQVKAKNKALHRCSRCKKRFACGSSVGTPNCGAFEPG